MSFNAVTMWWAENTRLIELLVDSLWETLVMVFTSGFIGFAVGIPLGVLLHLSKKNGLLENTFLNKVLGVVVNIGRSIPFIILLVALIPVTRFIWDHQLAPQLPLCH